ncbi:hypothetical protein LCGC14_0838280 [marine sediment metagenome]|uniref:Uncharacterized protein n=1 Tax=marine sediment metagenome TaxID=412755 RepID=A0A0F9RYK4_9ZZZZ
MKNKVFKSISLNGFEMDIKSTFKIINLERYTYLDEEDNNRKVIEYNFEILIKSPGNKFKPFFTGNIIIIRAKNYTEFRKKLGKQISLRVFNDLKQRYNLKLN